MLQLNYFDYSYQYKQVCTVARYSDYITSVTDRSFAICLLRQGKHLQALETIHSVV